MNKCRKFLSLLFTLTFLCGLFSLSVSAAEPEVEWLIPQRLKIGDCIWKLVNGTVGGGNPVVKGFNMPQGQCAAILPLNGLKLGYNLHLGSEPYSEIQGDGSWIGWSFADTVFRPGTYTFQIAVEPFEEEREPFSDNLSTKIGTPYQVIVEEPVIKTNAPTTVTIGSSIQLTTQLTNLNVSNKKIEDFKSAEVLNTDRSHAIGYRPSVEIIEGKSIVKQSEQDYTNTLNTLEKLTFTGEGTVKLKVKYEQIQTCEIANEIGTPALYSPEKTFTIQVKDNTPPTSTPPVETSQPTPSQGTTSSSNVDSSTTTSSTPSTSAPTETGTSQSSLVDTDTNIAITGDIPDNAVLEVKPISENEDTYTAIQEKLLEQVSRFQSYDINLLDTENVKVQPNGKVQISIPKPDGFGDNLAVYRTEEDGSMTLLNSEVKDGKVIFTTDHFSLYTIAEMEDTPAIAPPSGGIPTGGIVAIVIGALVVVAGGVTAGILLYKKKKLSV